VQRLYLNFYSFFYVTNGGGSKGTDILSHIILSIPSNLKAASFYFIVHFENGYLAIKKIFSGKSITTITIGQLEK